MYADYSQLCAGQYHERKKHSSIGGVTGGFIEVCIWVPLQWLVKEAVISDQTWSYEHMHVSK